MRRTFPLAVLALGALVATLAWTAAPARASGSNLTGREAPDFRVEEGLYGLPSGTSLSSMRGQVVVLKFFFTTCPACRASLPEFESLHRRYGPLGVRFIAVAYDSRSAVTAYWASHGLTVPVAIDEGGAAAARYGVFSYPTTYVIGADGRVAAYDALGVSVLEAALASARGASGSSSDETAPPAVVPAADRAERNCREVGVVPAALNEALGAARANDYGQVLRVAQAHEDPSANAPDVVAAAKRLDEIARVRAAARLARIERRWREGDPRGAYESLIRMTEDFRGTDLERPLAERCHRVYAYLLAEPGAAR